MKIDEFDNNIIQYLSFEVKYVNISTIIDNRMLPLALRRVGKIGKLIEDRKGDVKFGEGGSNRDEKTVKYSSPGLAQSRRSRYIWYVQSL